MPAVVTPVVVEPFSNGRSGNSTAAVGGDRGSGGRRQTPNDVSLHAGESRERAVSSQGAAIRNGLNADGGPPCSSAGSGRTRSSGTSISSTSKEDRDKGRPTEQGRLSGWAADFEAERSKGWVKHAQADEQAWQQVQQFEDSLGVFSPLVR